VSIIQHFFSGKVGASPPYPASAWKRGLQFPAKQATPFAVVLPCQPAPHTRGHEQQRRAQQGPPRPQSPEPGSTWPSQMTALMQRGCQHFEGQPLHRAVLRGGANPNFPPCAFDGPFPRPRRGLFRVEGTNVLRVPFGVASQARRRCQARTTGSLGHPGCRSKPSPNANTASGGRFEAPVHQGLTSSRNGEGCCGRAVLHRACALAAPAS